KRGSADRADPALPRSPVLARLLRTPLRLVETARTRDAPRRCWVRVQQRARSLIELRTNPTRGFLGRCLARDSCPATTDRAPLLARHRASSVAALLRTAPA